jgi:sporulation protein YlmC with PRC-barrel domain
MNYTTNVGERGLATEETARLIASDKVEGTSVYDRNGKYLGRIHHVMIDKYSGQVAYAVATFGGFLGIGENFFPLPWKVLEYDTSRAGYVADVDRGRLEQAPNYVPPNVPDWGDRSFSEEIDKYWLPPV